MMAYRFFLDETGDHGLSFIDPNFPLFLLCGCLLREDILLEFEEELDELKVDIFGTKEVVFHSRNIRKCEGSFQVLFDLDLKKELYERLNGIIERTEFTIIGAGVDKKEHVIKYGKGAKDPYALSLSFILERLIFCLDLMDKESRVEIVAEKRGKKEDGMLISHYNSIIDRGTYYVSSERFFSRIADFQFRTKLDNVNGLQLADLCAYPLARHVINPQEPYIPFKIIKGKIYCDQRGNIDGWGLKMFP